MGELLVLPLPNTKISFRAAFSNAFIAFGEPVKAAGFLAVGKAAWLLQRPSFGSFKSFGAPPSEMPNLASP